MEGHNSSTRCSPEIQSATAISLRVIKTSSVGNRCQSNARIVRIVVAKQHMIVVEIRHRERARCSLSQAGDVTLVCQVSSGGEEPQSSLLGLERPYGAFPLISQSMTNLWAAAIRSNSFRCTHRIANPWLAVGLRAS